MELNETALIRILTEPKNALIKQYKKLFEIEGVNLRFTDSALSAIAAEAIKRKSGARGLRAIIEGCMLDIMYEIPSIENVKECVIGEDVVLSKEEPILLYEQTQKNKPDDIFKRGLPEWNGKPLFSHKPRNTQFSNKQDHGYYPQIF